MNINGGFLSAIPSYGSVASSINDDSMESDIDSDLSRSHDTSLSRSNVISNKFNSYGNNLFWDGGVVINGLQVDRCGSGVGINRAGIIRTSIFSGYGNANWISRSGESMIGNIGSYGIYVGIHRAGIIGTSILVAMEIVLDK